MSRDLAELPDYLRARGFKVVGVPGWRDRRRPAYTGRWNPIGGLAHHTGGKGNGMHYAETVLARGYASLPGPLCQLGQNRQGTVIFVSNGRANHAGKVRRFLFWKAGDGNSQLLGIEAMNTGTEGWTTPIEGNPFGNQYNSYVALCAAVSDFMGWPREQWGGHGEASTSGKWDPGIRDAQTGRTRMLDMDAFRAAIVDVEFGADNPAAPEPEPIPVEPQLERIGKWLGPLNHAASTVGLSRPGKAIAWLRRRKRVVIIVRDKKPDVVGGLECGGGRWPNPWHYIRTKYAKFGLTLVENAGGRAIWRRTATTTHTASGVFKPTAWKGNVTEAIWYVGEVNDAPMLTVLAHLDHNAPLTHLKKVANQIIDHAFKTAQKHGLGKSQIVVMIDTADKTRRRVPDAIRARGFGSVFGVADRTKNAHLATMTYFKEPKRGDSVDYIFVWVGDQEPGQGPDRPRPVEVASKTAGTKPTDLDHLVPAAIINRQ